MPFKVTLLVLSIALTPAAGLAQTSVGIAAGATIPRGNLARIDNVGFHALATFASMSASGGAGIRVDAMFHQLSRKGTIQEVSERIVAVTASTVLPSANVPLSPYLVGGLGAYSSWTAPRAIGSTSVIDLGFNVGAGVRFGVVGRSAFAEARYHHVMSDGGPRLLPVTFGITF